MMFICIDLQLGYFSVVGVNVATVVTVGADGKSEYDTLLQNLCPLGLGMCHLL